MELTAEALVELFRGDARARKELVGLLISEPDIGLAVINAVLRDAATKSDIEALRAAMELGIEEMRSEFRRELGMLVERLYKLVMVSTLGIFISVATTILVRVLLPP